MDPIKGMNQIAQILRQKVSERTSSTASTKPQEGMEGQPPGAVAKASPDEIKRKIGERIKALTEEERRGVKAAQIFVEVVITWEFGEQLLQDPQFTNLSKDIVGAMAARPDTWQKLQALLDEIGKNS